MVIGRGRNRQPSLDILQHLELKILYLALLLLLLGGAEGGGAIRPVAGAAAPTERVLGLADAGRDDGLGPLRLLALYLDAFCRRRLVLEIPSPSATAPGVDRRRVRIRCRRKGDCILLRLKVLGHPYQLIRPFIPTCAKVNEPPMLGSSRLRRHPSCCTSSPHHRGPLCDTRGPTT